MADLRKHSSTSNIFRFVLKNSSTGQGLTGLSNASSGLIIGTICDVEATAVAYTVAGSNVESITTLGTFAAPSSNKCRFKEVDATNHPGLYEFQFADARFSVANAKRLVITVSGAANLLTADYEVQLTQADVYDVAALGLTRLDAAVTSRSSHSAADVWAVGTRTLSSFGTLVSDVATAVWAAGTRTLTSFGSLASDAATAVWAAGTRTLTSFGTMVADIWANVTRTLTSGGTTLYGESGSVTFTYTVYDTNGTTPLSGAAVYVSSDSDGVFRSQTKITDALGRVQFDLNPGTVYVWRSHPARTFSNPDTETVS